MALVEDFLVARKPLKGSPHAEAAYRRDLAGVSAQLAEGLGVGPSELVLGQLDTKVLPDRQADHGSGTGVEYVRSSCCRLRHGG